MLKVEPNFIPKKLLKLPKNLFFINGVTFILNISTIPFSFTEFEDLPHTLKSSSFHFEL